MTTTLCPPESHRNSTVDSAGTVMGLGSNRRLPDGPTVTVSVAGGAVGTAIVDSPEADSAVVDPGSVVADVEPPSVVAVVGSESVVAVVDPAPVPSVVAVALVESSGSLSPVAHPARAAVRAVAAAAITRLLESIRYLRGRP
jgi:hypothetical protein